MLVNFSKMHGLGNDFMVIDNVTQNVFFSPEKIQQLADRNFGIGFDQLLMVEPPYDPDQDFHYRIFNADGSEVSQCGNGARCFARFVKLKGLINRNKILVSTKAGKMILYLEKDGQVTVNMGVPNFTPAEIPLSVRVPEPQATKSLVTKLDSHTLPDTQAHANQSRGTGAHTWVWGF